MFTSHRLDRALTQQQADGTPPVSFLDHAQAERSAEEETRRRAALGAYLAARLVDRLVALDGTEQAEDGLRWQQQSTLHYVRDLPQDDAESPYLAAIVTAVQPGPGRRLPAVRIALRDYASFLEYEARFGESLDALRSPLHCAAQVFVAEDDGGQIGHQVACVPDRLIHVSGQVAVVRLRLAGPLPRSQRRLHLDLDHAQQLDQVVV